MALIAVSGHPGCRFEEVARIAAQKLDFELLTQARIAAAARAEFGEQTEIPAKAWATLATSVLAKLATEHHIVYLAMLQPQWSLMSYIETPSGTTKAFQRINNRISWNTNTMCSC